MNRVTLVRGRVTDIDRGSKAIVIDDTKVMEYDVLVLATGVKRPLVQENTCNKEYAYLSL